MKPNEKRPPLPQRFVASATIDGYEVIDAETGRSMGFARSTRSECNGIAQSLNISLRNDPKALTRALRGA